MQVQWTRSMGNLSTVRCRRVTVLGGVLVACIQVQIGSAQGFAQPPGGWRQAGNVAIDRGLAGLAGGPVSRVWFGGATNTIYALTLAPEGSAGRIFANHDFSSGDLEHWQPAAAPVPPLAANTAALNLPETAAQTRAGGGGRVYAFGTFVYRSDDGGLHWENATSYRGASLIGNGVHDLAVSPVDPDVIIVGGDSGVFRSVDGGSSWTSLNEGLPNLPVRRLWDLPAGQQGVRVELPHDSAAAWPPGDKSAWQPADAQDIAREAQLRVALSALSGGGTVTAVATSGNYIYAGFENGAIRVSADGGVTWQNDAGSGAGRVERLWVDARDPRIALASLGAAPADLFRVTAPAHVLHTVNGGGFWDDFTANLPDAAAYGLASDTASGAIYVATEAGVFVTYADLASLASAPPWTPVPGLPAAAVMDVKLDAQGNQLWAAVDGYGVFSILAPHRLRSPNVVSAADLVAGAVAPGSVVSILGARVDTIRANDVTAPVLAASAVESQVQIPFETRGRNVVLAATSGGVSISLPVQVLAAAAPSIFVAADGSPMLLDAEKGVMLDAMSPAHSGTRIQILATGLGRVKPAWPTGVPAPFENAPRVAGAVHVFLDRTSVEVTRAELAPGYVGLYLVEISLPKIANYGPAELYFDVDGAASNRVRVYIEP